MTTRRPAARRTSTSRTSSRSRSSRRTTRRPYGYPVRRRRRPGVSSTVGAALGTLVVTTLLDLSWPARLGLLALVLVVGLAYVVWRHRADLAAGIEEGRAQAAAEDAGGEPVSDPTLQDDPTDRSTP